MHVSVCQLLRAAAEKAVQVAGKDLVESQRRALRTFIDLVDGDCGVEAIRICDNTPGAQKEAAAWPNLYDFLMGLLRLP